MTTLPETNGRLVSITGEGTSEDWDSAEGQEVATRWSGGRAVYVVEEAVQLDGESLNEVTRTRIVMPVELGLLVSQGDTLTFDFRGETRTGHARDVQVHEVADEASVTLEET